MIRIELKNGSGDINIHNNNDAETVAYLNQEL